MVDPLSWVGLGVGVLGGIFQGFGANAARQDAINQWVQGEMQKAINNGKELFNATYQQQQVHDRNAAIVKSSYIFQQDSLDSARSQFNFAQNQISQNYRAYRGALANQLASSRISGGTSSALSLSQSANFLKQTLQTEKNLKQAEKNIDRQMQNMLAQQRNDIIIPNVQLSSAKPAGPSPWNMAAGLTSGVATGLGLYAQLQGPAGIDVQPAINGGPVGYHHSNTFVGAPL
jgi:hypothetical protein